MATYSTAWAWIIPTRPRPKKVFTESKAKKTAAAAGIAWAQVKKVKQGVRVQVRRKGHRPQSQTFATKGQAETWATQTEAAMVSGTFQDLSVARDLTVSALLARYCEERVLDSLEGSRIKLLQKALGHITLDQLHSAHCLDFVKKRRGTKVERLEHYEQWLARQVESGAEDPDDAAELLKGYAAYFSTAGIGVLRLREQVSFRASRPPPLGAERAVDHSVLGNAELPQYDPHRLPH